MMEDGWQNCVAKNWPELAQAFKENPRLEPQMRAFFQGMEDLIGSAAKKAADKEVEKEEALHREAAKMARYLVSPQGRAWLADRTAARECEVLRWAFAAELMQFGIPASKAVLLVERGITLRDIKAKPVSELERRVSAGWEYAERVDFGDFEEPVPEEDTSGPFEWTRWFDGWQKEIRRAELMQFGIPEEGAAVLVEQQITLRDMQVRSVGELVEGAGGKLEKEWFEIWKREVKRAEWIQHALSQKAVSFAGELMQFGVPEGEAALLVEQGITLRDIKTRPVSELVEQADGNFEKEWFEYWKRKIQHTELTQFGVSESEAALLVEQGITVDDVTIKPVDVLVEQAAGKLDQGWFESWKPLIESGIPARGAVMFPEQGITPLSELVKKLSRDLFPVRFYDLLVVSDFHLAAGNHPSAEGLARLSPTEDFYFDDAFFRFLYHCEKERRERDGYPYELVFNGDMIDFVQVVVRTSREFDIWSIRAPHDLWHWGDGEALLMPRHWPYGRSLSERLDAILDRLYESKPAYQKRSQRQREQKGRGRTVKHRGKVRAMERREALGQLADVYKGHRRFFQGLAWFLAQGNRLVVIRGNHDAQWYWPEVQLAFVGWLWMAYQELWQASLDPAARLELPVPYESLGEFNALIQPEDFETWVDFDHAWFYYRDRLAYLEHGGQHEALDAHRCVLMPIYSRDKNWPDLPAESAEQDLRNAPPTSATAWLPQLKVLPKEQEIDPPMGSLGNVFFINLLEWEAPNIDRPDYQEAYKKWLLYHRPRLLFVALRRAIGRLLVSWWDWFWRAAPNLQAPHRAKLKAYARLVGLPPDCVQDLDTTRWVKKWRNPVQFLSRIIGFVAPIVVSLIIFVIVFANRLSFLYIIGPYPTGRFKLLDGLLSAGESLLWGGLGYWLTTLLRNWIGLGEDYLFKPAQRVARTLKEHGRGVPYILFGHDHAHNAQPVDVGAQCSWCKTLLGKWGFLPARRADGKGWADRLLPWKWRWHIRFDRGRVKAPKALCPNPKCSAEVGSKSLKRQFDQLLRRRGGVGPDRIIVVCPKCGQEVSIPADTDLTMESVKCANTNCGHEISAENLGSSFPVSASLKTFTTVICPSCLESTPLSNDLLSTDEPIACRWCHEPIPKNALDMAGPITCHSCSQPLPEGIIDQIRVTPHYVTLHCPQCGREEHQWLGTWHQICPDCGKRPSKWDLRLLEGQSFIHCTCGCNYGGSYSLSPSEKRWYLNTGTWMHVYGKERKRLVREVHEYPFVRMIDTHRVLAYGLANYGAGWGEGRPKVELLRWNDAVGTVEPCETFKGTDED